MQTQFDELLEWRSHETDFPKQERAMLERFGTEVKTSFGTTLNHYFEELSTFCVTVDCLKNLLLTGSKDFFHYVINKNTRRKVWLRGFFGSCCRILDSDRLS